MVTLGVDAHKRTHTIVAVDETGRELGERTVAATSAGHLETLAWAEQWPARRWALEREITRLVARLSPSLLRLVGCGPLTAAKLVGEVAGIGRFRSRAAFAMHNGTAPVPVWSGNTERFRLNRGGNRQINVALHRIAITQMQRPGPAQEHITRRRLAGSTKSEALRSLRRFISDEVYRRMTIDAAGSAARLTELAAAA